MLADCEATLAGVLRFLGADVPGRRVARAVERNSFARMRAKEIAGAGGQAPMGSRAQVRAGTAGQWRSQLSAGQQARFWAAMPQLARMGYEE
jgi:hypothetical protein